MTARGWMLFAAMALLWGVPYLFIKETVDTFTPFAMVAGRTLGGALLLLPFALHRRALRPALARWPWVLAFGAVEMGAPFLLLGHAEQTLPSGTTGLLVATVPLVATIIAILRGDRTVLRPLRMLGLVIGFGGVAVIVGGPTMIGGLDALIAVGEVMLVAVCYATAPFIVAAKLADVPSLGSITIALTAVGLFYLPFAVLVPSEPPTLRSGLSLLGLAVLCTAIAFIAFFALIDQVGPARAPLFTYVNPIIAIVLGVLLLGENLSPGLLVGVPLVILGCWLAATGGRLRATGKRLRPAGGRMRKHP